MAEVSETLLPGVGVRHDFTTGMGDRLGVLVHRTGRRELLIYDRADPDACRASIDMDPDDARTLAELLGASQVSEAISSIQHIEGLAIDWLMLAEASPLAGLSVGEAAIRTRTGVTIVAVLRGDEALPAPGPDFALQPGDVVVTVGVPEGIAELRRLLAG
jgi:TrkA domain protein